MMETTEGEKWMTFQELREESPIHTDPLLREHELLLVTITAGAGLVHWDPEEAAVVAAKVYRGLTLGPEPNDFYRWAEADRWAAYLDELDGESPMGFPGEEIAAMLRHSPWAGLNGARGRRPGDRPVAPGAGFAELRVIQGRKAAAGLFGIDL